MWEEILKFIGGASVLLGAVAWLIRSLSVHLLSKDIEKYKLDLRREADKELEELKSSLSLEALTHQIRFSKLHDRRAEEIEKIYKQIVSFERSASSFMAEFNLDDYQELKKKADDVIDMFYQFSDYTDENKIFFSDELAKKIRTFKLSLLGLSVDIVYNSNEQNYRKFYEEFKKRHGDFVRKNKNIRREIENEFRVLLGDKVNPSLNQNIKTKNNQK